MSTSHNPEISARQAARGGLGAHLSRAQEIAPGWLILYVASFALALPCAVIRAMIAYPVVWIGLELIGEPTTPVNDLALLAGYGPLVVSVATLILPFGGWWWQQQAGGRSPSRREHLVFEEAIATLKQADPGLRPPRRWFVMDTVGLHASVLKSFFSAARILRCRLTQRVLPCRSRLGNLTGAGRRRMAPLAGMAC